MTDQWYIKKVSWWLCDYVSEWYINIFRESWDALWACVKDTRKVKKESFVCETVKKQIQNSES